MAAGNGHGPLTDFKVPQGIPIIGQPFVVKAGFITIMGQCKCGGEETNLLLAGGPAQCPSCKRVWVLTKAQYDAASGQLQTAVGLVRMDPPPAAEGEPT